MCGRYYIDPDDNVEELLAIPKATGDAKRTGEIRPADTTLVIANNRRLEPRLFPMKWGFPHPDGKLLIINARSETAQEKPAFADSSKSRRCIVPASGYYEWGRKNAATGKKPKYAFSQPRSRLIFMAGLYMFDEQAKNSYYTILTRDATPRIALIHGRMPVILPQKMIAKWLSPFCDYSDILEQAIANIEVMQAEG